MPIPADIRSAVLDLLREPEASTEYDDRLDTIYDRALDRLVRETDLFAERETIATVVDQSLYSTTERVMRVLAVLWNRIQLRPVASFVLDLLQPQWQNKESGDPESLRLEQIPGSLDLTTTNPQHFAVEPPPIEVRTGEKGFIVFEIARPVEDSVVLLYIRIWLIYQVCASFCSENTDVRDSPSAAFWQEVADTWRALIDLRVPV